MGVVRIIGDDHSRLTSELELSERLDIVEQARILALNLVVNGTVEDLGQFPVNVYRIASKLNVVVKEGPLSSRPADPTLESIRIAGVIRKESGEEFPMILLERSGSEQHKRFTAAHELGHYLFWLHETSPENRLGSSWFEVRPEHSFPDPLGDSRDNSFDSISGELKDHQDEGDKWPSEFAANTFAQFLLMPDQTLTSCLQGGMNVSQIAVFFGVTEYSAKRRLSYFDMASQEY